MVQQRTPIWAYTTPKPLPKNGRGRHFVGGRQMSDLH